MKKGGKETVNYTKWKDSGYVDGIDEATASLISEYLEGIDTAMKLQADINSHKVRTQQGDVSFNKLEIGLEVMVDLYQKKKNPNLVVDYDDLYDEMKLAISQRGGKMFDSDQVSDGLPFFDSVNLNCFKEWFLNSYSVSISGK